jgi:hypothetical protein
MEGSLQANVVRLQTAFGGLSEQEMTVFTDLLQRIRQGFAQALE